MTEQELEKFGRDFRKLDKEDKGRVDPVTNYFDTFLCGGVIDPVALWALRHLIRDNEIREIMFLLDWLPSAQIGKKDSNTSLKKAVEYCQNCWEKPQMIDPTLSWLMWAPWSRELLKRGHCLPVNALWGVRKFKEETWAEKEKWENWEHLLNTARNTIMRPIIDRTGAKEIYACHANLRLLQESLSNVNVTYLYHPAYDVIYWLTKRLVPEKDMKAWKKSLE